MNWNPEGYDMLVMQADREAMMTVGQVIEHTKEWVNIYTKNQGGTGTRDNFLKTTDREAPDNQHTAAPALGTTLAIYHGHSYEVGALAVAWSPDGRRIASGSGDKTVQVWDAATGATLYIYRGHASWVNAVAWSPDGCRIASGSTDEGIQVWDAVTGTTIFSYRGHTSSVNAVA